MPDRIVRDELLESSRWLSLKDNADRLAYLALLLKADAFGNFTADPWRLRRLWQDFGIVDEKAVAKTLAELVDHDLVRVYDEDGQRYLHIPRYRQRLRYTKRRNAPASPWCEPEDKQAHAANSPGDSQAQAGRKSGAHPVRTAEGRKEVKRSEGYEEKDAREQPVDNSPSAPTTQSGASTLKVKGNSKPKATPPPGWWKSDADIATTAAAYGVTARPGEGFADLKRRTFDAIAAAERG